ncbi:hypothetical protein SAMN05216312_106149 [Cohnella sp. OV330]|uniref:hypothetical protein n=1 Tax=Cohnella sp. OV330 TaxID=1855288 RepID=UPI0008E028D5|nr:hypothetical protein [Cohnella sp. OV330]SFB34768.1 hypothetical protein SAMN05216312_106149 [Cohnella sp. OV330]
MGRSMGKLALLAALIALAVLFGMEMADDGIRTVYGPVGSDGATVGNGGNAADSAADSRAEQRSRYYAEEPQGIAYEGETGDTDASATGSAARRQTLDSARSGQTGGEEQDPYAIPRPDGEPLVDSLADKTASTLQRLSQSGVKAVVSLFDKLSGS